MALQGKRIFVTGGAGFIATTLAKRLVDENEVVAVDNFHRDALSGTALADHPNFTVHQADVLDGAAIAELARGATHIVHCAAIAGVDRVRESPVRTMRVNVIGTYNVLEAALATKDTLVKAKLVRVPKSVYRASPGAERLRPGSRTPVGNLLLAGCYTNHRFPASIEGAMRSARAAVDVVLERSYARA